MWEMHDGMGWWMVFAGVWLLLFWVIIIAGIVWVFVRAARGYEMQDSAIEIARRRYARGEISQEEFLRIRKEVER